MTAEEMIKKHAPMHGMEWLAETQPPIYMAMIKSMNAFAAQEIKAVKRDLRRAVADYMASEGCNCCEGDDHSKHADAIAKLLGVKKYKDGSGYDFSKYESK